MSHLQDSVVESVNILTLSLRDFGKLEPSCSEVTDWFAKFFESLQNIVDIIGLVRLQVEVIVNIFTIWSGPNQQHACLHLSAGYMAHGTVKNAKTGTFEFPKFVQKVVRLSPFWCYRWCDVRQIERIVFINYLEICWIGRIQWGIHWIYRRITLRIYWRITLRISTNSPLLLHLLFTLKLVHELLSPDISSFTVFHASNLIKTSSLGLYS